MFTMGLPSLGKVRLGQRPAGARQTCPHDLKGPLQWLGRHALLAYLQYFFFWTPLAKGVEVGCGG